MEEAEKLRLEWRLENWGAWARGEGSPCRKGRSPLLAIMIERGFQFEEPEMLEEGEEPEKDRVPVDEKDAAIVQKAWQDMPDCREKKYLAERYVFRRSGGKALRGLKHESKRWCIWWAYQMMWNRLTKAQHVV